jgi:biopolymer transport protein TolQ
MTYAVAATGPAKEAVVTISAIDAIGNAGIIVQLVLLLLVLFSVLSWAIMLSKWGLVKRCFSSTERFLDVFWSGKSMDHIYSESKKMSGSSVAKLFQSGYVELQRLMEKERQKTEGGSTIKVPPDSLIQNLERALMRASRNEMLRLERSMTFLATAGSTAPFIGLFGTVWGIMTAFERIGAEGGASLATVAPGISEALIATAVGLACAIPAVMGYNYFNQKIRMLRAQMENFSGDFLNIVKRNFLMG